MKAYKSDNKDPITVLRFIPRFKRACDSNDVLEAMALWIMPTSIKDGSAFSLTVQMMFYKNDGTAHRLPKAGEEQISTYAEAVNFLLKLYATGFNIPKATLEIAALRKTTMEAPVQFADILRPKVIRCGNAYPKERTMRAFIYSSSASIQSAAGMFWGREQDADFLKIVQYTATLLKQARQVPSPATTQNQRSRFDKSRAASQVVATVGETQGQVPRRNDHSIQKQREVSPP